MTAPALELRTSGRPAQVLWAVVAGGVVAGATAARFLEASSTRRYEARQFSSTYGGGT